MKEPNKFELENSIDCYDYVSNAYVVYGSNVNTSRAFPSIYDGLKPVQRKIILSAYDVANNKEVGSANIVGNCFTGDTEILNTNGQKIKISDLYSMITRGESVYTFSCDKEGKISTTKIVKVWKNKSERPLVRVEIDSGESVRCTDNHLFMLRNGEYKEAKDLNKNELLMNLDIIEYSNKKYMVSSVVPCQIEDVYDIEVDSVNHNFLLGIGVFVHNCIANLHPHSDCLLGSTKVLLSDYSTVTIEQLTDSKKAYHEVFSFDPKTGGIVTSIAHSFRSVVKDNLWLIKLSDGGEISCSGNHPILMRDKSYKRTEDLSCGDLVYSLELNRKKEIQYTLVSVVSVQKISEEDIVLYDFTVDNYENMIIETGKNTFVSVHNSGVYKAMVNMINAEDPVLSGHGAFGYKGGLVEIEAAQMRYTAACLNQFGLKLFCEYINYVEKEENELYNLEQKYLPTPIPYAMLNGASGIGVGVTTSIPSCTVNSIKSWISRYLRTGKIDGKIIPKYSFIQDDEELSRFNKEGVGTFQFYAKVEKSEDKKSVFVSDFPTYISPSKLLNEFKLEIQSKLVNVVQLNDLNNKPIVKITKAPYSRSINVDDIFNRAKKCMTKSVTFKCVVTDGSKAYIFGPQNWLKFTVDYYLSFVDFGLKKEIECLNESILFNTVKKRLAELFLKKMKNEEIAEILSIEGNKVSVDTIQKWSKKSISTLRSDEVPLDELKKKLEETNKKIENIKIYTLEKICSILG